MNALVARRPSFFPTGPPDLVGKNNVVVSDPDLTACSRTIVSMCTFVGEGNAASSIAYLMKHSYTAQL